MTSIRPVVNIRTVSPRSEGMLRAVLIGPHDPHALPRSSPAAITSSVRRSNRRGAPRSRRGWRPGRGRPGRRGRSRRRPAARRSRRTAAVSAASAVAKASSSPLSTASATARGPAPRGVPRSSSGTEYCPSPRMRTITTASCRRLRRSLGRSRRARAGRRRPGAHLGLEGGQLGVDGRGGRRLVQLGLDVVHRVG